MVPLNRWDGRRPSSRSHIGFNRGTIVLMRRSCRWRKCRQSSEKVSEVPFPRRVVAGETKIDGTIPAALADGLIPRIEGNKLIPSELQHVVGPRIVCTSCILS